MTVSAAINVNQILNRVAVEAGLDASNDPFSSNDKNFVQLRNLLQTGCEDLCVAYPWEFLLKDFTFVTVADQSSYDLPEDFLGMVSDTGWNLSDDEPVILLSPQQWRAMEAGDIDPIQNGYRIYGGKIQLTPIENMPAGIEVKFEYLSSKFAVTTEATPQPISTISSGSDIVLFDRTLITRYLKLLWFEAKGFDTIAAQQNFNQMFDMITSKDKTGTIINAGGGRTGFRLIDNCNVPSHGYGQW